MTQAIRWWAMPSTGSFVGINKKLEVVVAPMNADGTRSTYEGEIIEEGGIEDADLLKQDRRWVLVGKLADGFRRVLRSWLTEAELIEIDARNEQEPEDSNVCHSHDFCDANMAMHGAFSLALHREMVLDSESDEGERDRMLFNDAWEVAKAEGLRSYRPTTQDFDLLEGIASTLEKFGSGVQDATALRLFADRLRSILEPMGYDPSTDADNRKA